MTSSFWVSRQHGHRLRLILFILCVLYVDESQSISEANNNGLQTQQCPPDWTVKRLEILVGVYLIPKERRPELQSESSKEEDKCVYKTPEWINTEIMRNRFEILV